MIPLYFPPINKLGNAAFRKLCLDYGADYVFSEMVRVDKLLDGDEHQLGKASIDPNLIENTFIQIIAEDISNIEKGVEKIVEINPKIKEINYNMGCPQSRLCKLEIGGGLIKNSKKVYEVSKRLFDICSKFGVRASVKIRIGKDRDNINILENVEMIRKAGILKIYIHGRTLRDGYNRPATYDEIKEAIGKYPDLEIIGNGDVCGVDSFNKIIETNCSGVLIGRAALENPQVFLDIKNNVKTDIRSGETLSNRLEMIKKYLVYVKEYDLSISHLKTNLSYLTRGVIGGAEFRKEINNISEIDSIIDKCNKL